MEAARAVLRAVFCKAHYVRAPSLCNEKLVSLCLFYASKDIFYR